jgi:DNA-binding IclR family transcriptional regulator
VARAVNARGRVSVDDLRPASANYHANALARGLALLELLAARATPQTLTDFSNATALPKSTLVRLLSVLTEMEYVVRIDDRPSYRLGYKVQRLATAYVSALDLSVVAEAYLAPLAAELGQTANLGLLDGDQVLQVCVSEPDRQLRFMTHPGARDHAYCTALGKLLLSRLDPAVLPNRTPPEPFPAFTDNTITSFDGLARELRKVTRRGYALDDAERSVGLRSVAVGVPVGGECPAAISISGPAGEFTPAQQALFVEQLRAVAADLAADEDFAAALGIVLRSLSTTNRLP